MEKRKILNLNFSFQQAMHYHINGGMLLMGAVLLAMILANSPWGDVYASFWNHEIRLQIGEFNFFSHNGHHMTLMSFINDALMAVFFFSVGLEIKREILVGELSSFRQALLPIVAACGGMLFPVLIYYFMTAGTPAQSGLAIPMATDIAFSLGVLNLFGKRVPLSLKVFLTAFAVVDDIGGILVIALFYSSHLSVHYLLASAGILAILCGGNIFHVHNRWFYVFGGGIMWYLFLQSGIHATIAGVIAAFTVPATPHYKIGRYINHIRENISVFPASDKESIVLSKMQINVLKSIESSSDRVISPLQSLEDSLHGMVNYMILPLFAFANAGISLTAEHGGIEVGTPTWAVMTGLLVGKFVGIYFFTWLVIKTGFAGLLKGMTWVNLTGICLLGGIGFTVSLFMANLSFAEAPVLLAQAKMGVILGTLLAGMLAYLVLKLTLPGQSVQE
ncbi:Na+/H+ antiporter NhaA [uncultured Phocaeicola sp.]|uniref:Na+/H+ antiporter NhaA n=1 Tax=uncultured Phocaeicola sp. TaxID=990718 RepID=UPI00143352F8|nr:Na+/H+ antiporter NhaA [uncultured Phocaeicola sp.]GFH97797.1 Na(+)/H(+) antiporter NhaA [Bacteroidaceae bacterium]